MKQCLWDGIIKWSWNNVTIVTYKSNVTLFFAYSSFLISAQRQSFYEFFGKYFFGIFWSECCRNFAKSQPKYIVMSNNKHLNLCLSLCIHNGMSEHTNKGLFWKVMLIPRSTRETPSFWRSWKYRRIIIENGNWTNRVVKRLLHV